MKTGNFISGIVCLLFSIVLTVVCYNEISAAVFKSGGVGSVSFIISIPLLAILYFILVMFLFGSVINTVLATLSESCVIKSVSFVLIIIEVGVIVINLLKIIPFIGGK